MLLTLLAVIALILPFLYDASATFRYYSKFYVYYGYVMVASVILLPAMAFRPRDVSNLILAAKVCRVVSRILGLRWTVHGKQLLALQQPCVMVANHQSSLDILGMFEIWDIIGHVTVIAKRELLYTWPFGLAAWLGGLIFINRTDPNEAKSVINCAVEELVAKKVKLWVFPEGTRRNTGTIHPFKKGAFHVAVATQIPILPIVFSQYNFLDSGKKSFIPGSITITALPPIETAGLTTSDVEIIMEKTRAIMLDAFNPTCSNNAQLIT